MKLDIRSKTSQNITNSCHGGAILISSDTASEQSSGDSHASTESLAVSVIYDTCCMHANSWCIEAYFAKY